MARNKDRSIEINRKTGASEGRTRGKNATAAEVRRTPEEDEEFSRRSVKTGLKIFTALLIVAGLVLGYRAAAASSIFQPRQILVSGNDRLSSDTLIKAVRELAGPSLISADLYNIRRELQALPLVKSAQITRVLPDTLRVKIEERVPVALAKQRDNSLVWVSDDAVALGDLDRFHDGAIPPILSGLLSDSGSDFEQAENERRIALCRQIIRDLDSETPKLSSLIDEINLNTPKDAVLQLSDSRIQVHAGEKNFRQHLKLALDVLDAARRKDAAALSAYRVPDLQGLIDNASRITYFNVLRPERISVGFAAAKADDEAAGGEKEQKSSQPEGKKGSSTSAVKTTERSKEKNDGKASRPVHSRN